MILVLFSKHYKLFLRTKMQRFKLFFLQNISGKQTIVKNTIWLFAGEGVGRLLRFILIVFAARTLSAQGLGVFSYALSIASIFTFFADWGLNTLIIKSLSQQSDIHQNHEAAAIVGSKFILTIFMSAAAFLIAPHLSSITHVETIIFITISISFFDTLRDFAIAINRSTEKMEREAFIRIVTNLLICVCGVVGLILVPSATTMALAYLIGSSIGCVISFIYVRNTITTLIPLCKRSTIRNIFEIAWPFAVLNLISICLSNIDILSLGKWDSATHVGIYAAAQRAAQFFYIIPSLFSFALFPKFSREAISNPHIFQSLIERSLVVLCAITFPIIIGGIVTSSQILRLLFGNEFVTGSTTFILLIACLPLVFLQIILSSALVATGKQKKLITSGLIGITTGIICCILLVPALGMIGAAMSIFATHLVTSVIIWKNSSHHILMKNIVEKTQRILIASLITGVAAYAAQYIIGNMIVTICIGICSYAGMLLLQKEPLIEEVRELFV